MSTVATQESPLLSISELQYAYPSGLHALNGIDLDLGAGEIIAIVGPSGCGKSTLLSLVSGLAEPIGGSLVWDEKQLQNDGGAHSQKLAMMFQRDTVYPWRTIEKNVQFGMESTRTSAAEKRKWTDQLLEMANLQEFAKVYPKALSGGMRRRVGLMMALAVRPKVLLLDEPFSALDEPTRVELAGEVLNLAYRQGVSVILVTHDLGEALSVADRVLVFSNRPAKVQRVVEVPFGHDRDVIAVRETPEYAELYQELWHELWGAIREGRGQGLQK